MGKFDQRQLLVKIGRVVTILWQIHRLANGLLMENSCQVEKELRDFFGFI
jgi:hypothetical protein